MGAFSMSYDPTDELIYVLHADAYGALGSTEHDAQYFTIDPSDDSVSASQTLSPTKVNRISTPRRIVGTEIPWITRGDVASLYDVSGEALILTAPPPTDTSPPGQVSAVSVEAIDADTLRYRFTMPPEADTGEWEIRVRIDGTDPAGDRSDGTVPASGGSGSAGPGEQVTTDVSGLTTSEIYHARIFAADAESNWNTGVLAPLETPHSPIAEVGWFSDNGDGTMEFIGVGEGLAGPPPKAGRNPIWVGRMELENYAGNLPAAHRAIAGLDQALPPTNSIRTFVTGWEYETSGITEAQLIAGTPGVWANGDGGVPPAFHDGNLIRVRTTLDSALTWAFAWQREQ
jgi:hypothetical protein